MPYPRDRWRVDMLIFGSSQPGIMPLILSMSFAGSFSLMSFGNTYVNSSTGL